MSEPNEPIDHKEVLELLPWFVNGTLTEEEHDLVERHLHECLPCHLELREQRRLSGLVRKQPIVHVSAEQGFDELMGHLESGARRQRPVFLAAVQALTGSSRLVLAGTAFIALLGMVAWLSFSSPQTTPATDYVTLSDEPDSRALLLDIVFSEQVTEPQLQQIVGELGATIVDGPSEVGRYTVRMEASETSDSGSAIIRRLSADERIRFVGPSLTERPQ